MEKKELLDLMAEYKNAIKAIIEEKAAAEAERNDAKVTELEGKLAQNEMDMKKIQDHVDLLEKYKKFKDSEAKGEIDDDRFTLNVKSLLNSDKWKSAKEKAFKGKGNNLFEMKFDTGDITGTVNMTRQNRNVRFLPERQMAFMPYLRQMSPLAQDENRVLWVTGSYTSNAGYVGEGVGNPTGDAGTATEATRAMAKVSAWLLLTAEMLEDANYIAQALRAKMIEKLQLFIDGELYLGNGDDPGNTNLHIFGILNEATPYVKPTGLNIADPNIADLIDACDLQSENEEQGGIDIVWMNKTDYLSMKKTKDDNGQYLFQQEPDGTITLSGAMVIPTNVVSQNELTVARMSAIQLWWKRSLEIKMSQEVGNDFLDDVYRIVGFARLQGLIEDVDKPAVIHVDDIASAVAGLVVVP